MISLVQDGMKGETPRYGTPEELQEFYASKGSSWHEIHCYRPVLDDSGPVPFSGILVFDFFACITLAPDFSIFKHFYGISPTGDLPCIPDETLASGALLVSQADTSTISLVLSIPVSVRNIGVKSAWNKG